MARNIYRTALGILPDRAAMTVRRVVGAAVRIFNPPSTTLEPEPVRFDGRHSRRWWATRDAGGASSAPGYWETRSHPLRTEIGRTVSSLGASSIIEIGCHAGMNLWSASRFQEWQRMAGVELSETVLAFTRNVLPEAIGQDVELRQASADALPFPDKSFDVALSAVTLVCIGPEEIEKALAEICRVARRWIVLAEPIEIDPRFATAAGREDPYPNTMYWIRDYAGLLEGRAVLRSLKPMPRGQQLGHLNSIAVFELTDHAEAVRQTPVYPQNTPSVRHVSH